MNILDLSREKGLDPKKVGQTNGGEYKSSCPGCKDGKDRFCIWPNQGLTGRYWCRFCGKTGDAIQFCIDFLDMHYLDACKKLKVELKCPTSQSISLPPKSARFSAKTLDSISDQWGKSAALFIQSSTKYLLKNPSMIDLLFTRGITLVTIHQYSLGWNQENIFDNRTAWGLPRILKDNGKERTLWLPKGIVIPSFQDQSPIKIKIRRTEWSSNDDLPKYVEVAGSLQRPSTYGDKTKPILIVESELDAILIQQFASDLCCCIALGGVGKKPDKETDEYLKSSHLILLALDYDEAGKANYPFWMQLYPQLRPWPSRKGKSPGDSYNLHKIDLRQWVKDGLQFIC